MTSFDGAEFLATARELKDVSEADKRSAISRAYYAAFLLAKEYVRISDVSVIRNDGSDHAAVPRYLERLKHFRESQKTPSNFRKIVREVTIWTTFNASVMISD